MQQVLHEGLFEYRKNGLEDKILSRGNAFSWEQKALEYLQVYRSLL